MAVGNALKVQSDPLSRKLRREAGIGEISRRLLVENYAPASVVINRKREIIYLLGAVGKFLTQPAGRPTQDLLALAPLDLRDKLRPAIQCVFRSNLPGTIPGGRTMRGGAILSYRIDLLPFQHDEPLQLICFVTEPLPALLQPQGGHPAGHSALEQELQAVKAELQGAIRDLEMSNEESRTIHEEALAENQELMDCQEGLETRVRQMTELNAQLEQALQAQGRSAEILGNILNNIGAAILVLDRDLKIRFFTPAIEPFFHLIASDIGRPLGDLKYLAPEGLLPADCRAVLKTPQALDREIELAANQWFLRRILPYCADNGDIDGLVISFSDITETRAMLMTETAGKLPETHLTGRGTMLRHLLQTLSQLQGPLDNNLSGEAGQELVRLVGQAASALSFSLGSLVDSKRSISASDDAARRVANLTPREQQIMKLVVAGHPSKIIATDLGISQRTVENHRAAIMRKTQSKSLPALARAAFASGLSDIAEAGDFV